MGKYSNFGSRSTDRFGFVSLNDPRTCAIPEEQMEKYQETLELSDLPAIEGLAEPPLIVHCEPLRPDYDRLIPMLGLATSRISAAREIFRNHVFGFDNADGDLLDVKVNNRTIGSKDLEKVDPLLITECASAIVMRSSRGGDVPLPRTSLATWRAMRTQLERDGALNALIGVATSGVESTGTPDDLN